MTAYIPGVIGGPLRRGCWQADAGVGVGGSVGLCVGVAKSRDSQERRLAFAIARDGRAEG